MRRRIARWLVIHLAIELTLGTLGSLLPVGGYVMWLMDLWHWVVPGVLIGLGSLCSAGLVVILWAHREVTGDYARRDVLFPALERYMGENYATREEIDDVLEQYVTREELEATLADDD